MAKASRELIYALRKTAVRLRSGAPYQWGHLGSCNCGHLAQTLTLKSKGEIHAEALKRVGDWGDVSAQYCETSGLPIDDIIGAMLNVGLNLNDIENLENLTDRKVLAQLPAQQRSLKHNNRDDVVTYLTIWANLLESQLEEPPESEPKSQIVQASEEEAA
jgi:hypothetical protein